MIKVRITKLDPVSGGTVCVDLSGDSRVSVPLPQSTALCL